MKVSKRRRVTGLENASAGTEQKHSENRDENGSVLLLILGYAVIALMVTAVLAGATGLYVAQRRLTAIADAAALSAAEAYDLSTARLNGNTVEVALSPESVDVNVRDYVRILGNDRFESLDVVSATTPDGRSVQVTLAATWKVPLVSELLPTTVDLTATSSARGVLQ